MKIFAERAGVHDAARQSVVDRVARFIEASEIAWFALLVATCAAWFALKP